jgi:hypothetical protein
MGVPACWGIGCRRFPTVAPHRVVIAHTESVAWGLSGSVLLTKPLTSSDQQVGCRLLSGFTLRIEHVLQGLHDPIRFDFCQAIAFRTVGPIGIEAGAAG